MKEIKYWKAFRWPLLFVILLWIIEAVSVITETRAIWLGIIPRTISGFPGIFFSPFIHGNYEHLLSNTLPLLVAGTGVIFFYREIASAVIAMIWLLTGFWVWLAARDSSHIGASGIIYGLVCFLFFSGLMRKDTRLMAVSLTVTILYGGMVWGILPMDQSISWESHLFGSIAGIFCAVYFRKEGPQRPKAQWEIDEELEAQMGQSSFHDDDYWNEETDPSTPLRATSVKINYDFVPKSKDENQTSPENKS